MKKLIFAALLLSPSVAFAVDAYEIKARDHDCKSISDIIRQHGAVFVRTGFGGRSFRYPPAQCDLGDKYVTVALRDINKERCVLDYACVNDPESFYNRIFHHHR